MEQTLVLKRQYDWAEMTPWAENHMFDAIRDILRTGDFEDYYAPAMDNEVVVGELTRTEKAIGTYQCAMLEWFGRINRCLNREMRQDPEADHDLDRWVSFSHRHALARDLLQRSITERFGDGHAVRGGFKVVRIPERKDRTIVLPGMTIGVAGDN